MTLKDVFATAAAVILSLGGGAALVLGLSSWLGNVFANRILEKERAQLQKEGFEHQTRFSWYHQQKAELIANVYALLNDAIEHVKQLVSPFQSGDEAAREKHANATIEVFNKLAAEYWGKKIFLEKDICIKVEEILKTMRTAISDFQISQDPQLKDTKLWSQAYKSMDKQVPPLLAELEETFRSMLSKIGPAA